LFNHSHGGGYTIGKKEFVEGRSYLQPEPYAKALTARGYVALCIDHWVFGERNHDTEEDTFKAMLWEGRVLWGMMVYDSLRALDVLAARPDVDPARIATLGMSMGSTMAWWLAALDERVSAAACVACLTRYGDLLAHRALARHGIYYFVPGMLRHFDTEAVVSLIAPRPLLTLTGDRDPGSPVSGVRAIHRTCAAVYALHGRRDRLTDVVLPRTGHVYTPAMWRTTLGWLDRHLRPVGSAERQPGAGRSKSR
jgi:dienelactone hydrolase